MVEKRLYKRTQKNIRITWQNENVRFDGITSDICPGGVFIITDQSLPRGTLLDVELWFDGLPPVRCSGKIAWVNRGEVVYYPAGFGVQFLELSEDSLAQVLRMCQQHS